MEIATSRESIMQTLIDNGDFAFGGFIQNEVGATALNFFKYMAKYCGISAYEANKITTNDIWAEKLAEKSYDGKWLREAAKENGFNWNERWDSLESKMDFCYNYGGTPWNSSIAASGVILTEKSPDLPYHENNIAYNGEDLEKEGYIKYDLLSINTLNPIQYFKGLDVDWNNNDDDNVWDTICRGDTDFVFQFSSPGMKEIIKNTQPRSIISLAEINALYRPGPMGMGMVEKYEDLKHGKLELNENEQVLSNILKKEFGDTHSGLVIFQEDVMKLCQEGANFTLAEADNIRKAMGKKKADLMNSYKEQFINNWKYDGDPSEIWHSLEDFSKYAFNKSHAVAYAIIAYQTAWIWTYKKFEFLEFLMNYGTKKNCNDAIDACKKMNIKIVYPDITNMGSDKYKIIDNKLILPGYADKNYNSYVDFIFDTECKNRAELIRRGVCDKLTPDRDALLDLISMISNKNSEVARYMEPENITFKSIEEIVKGLKACDFIYDYEEDRARHEVIVTIYRPRAREKYYKIRFRNKNNSKENIVKYDLKYYNAIRPGTLSNIPYINTRAIESRINQIKNTCENRGMSHSRINNTLCKKLEEYMNDNNFSDPNSKRGKFRDLTVVLLDYQVYNRSTKCIVQFGDKEDFFYATDKEDRDLIKKLDKKSIIMIDLYYSPFIKLKTSEFVYDFDIHNVRQLG